MLQISKDDHSHSLCRELLPRFHVCQVFVSHAGVPGPEERLWEEWMQKAPDEAGPLMPM